MTQPQGVHLKHAHGNCQNMTAHPTKRFSALAASGRLVEASLPGSACGLACCAMRAHKRAASVRPDGAAAASSVRSATKRSMCRGAVKAVFMALHLQRGWSHTPSLQ